MPVEIITFVYSLIKCFLIEIIIFHLYCTLGNVVVQLDLCKDKMKH